jgi:hypothetical protein
VQDIIRVFTQAWYSGAADEGIKPDELSAEEINRLQSEIANEASFIANFGNDIVANSRAAGGRLEPLLSRSDLWANGYTRIRAIARLMAAKDKKKIWTLNPAEHCPSCLKLEGKVKRASYWIEHGVQPKAWDKLVCKLGCKCTLEDTDLPLSKGPLPSLP